VEFWYNNKLFHSVRGEEILVDTMNMKHKEEREVIAFMQAGDKMVSERKTLAANPYKWIVDL
jgi:hypothetical protein